ncbi:hypothetical protein E6O75_ATG09588 [Venturia nashicola]|uniref:Uncharacterized protein n=1 Tax=Venturia nashicola TaxID=86259 RepID=A0A4Z1NZ11_9PEZI|nr:hypothetical protein E6O75_ATG09588 [Venturia nashicola]
MYIMYPIIEAWIVFTASSPKLSAGRKAVTLHFVHKFSYNEKAAVSSSGAQDLVSFDWTHSNGASRHGYLWHT